MIKSAQLARILQALRSPTAGRIAGGVAGAGTGGALGYYVTPELFGYEDVPKARRVSAYGDALVGGVLGTILGSKGSRAWAAAKLRALPATAQLSLAGAPVLAEAPPIIAAKLVKEREAAEAAGAAAKQFGDAAKSISIPNAISNLTRSGGFQGVVGGAAVAGLGGMLTGMLRPKNRREVINDSGRGEMMRSDALKYLLPALVAGGVIGSLRSNSSV